MYRIGGRLGNQCASIGAVSYTHLMVGRGALGHPWVFSQINAWLSEMRVVPPPSMEERLTVMRRQIMKICANKGEAHGMKEARKHVGWYLKGFRGAAQFRGAAGTLSSVEDSDTGLLFLLYLDFICWVRSSSRMMMMIIR